jgi:hypothetical protein
MNTNPPIYLCNFGVTDNDTFKFLDCGVIFRVSLQTVCENLSYFEWIQESANQVI